MDTQTQAPEAPAAIVADSIIVQSQDLDSFRWKDLRSDMVEVFAGIGVKLGFTVEPNEALLDAGFPREDESRFDDGTLDIDFEETSIETLMKIAANGRKLAAIADRFAHNLKVRDHNPKEPAAPEADTGDEG